MSGPEYDAMVLQRRIFEFALKAAPDLTDDERRAAYALAGERAAEILSLPMADPERVRQIAMVDRFWAEGREAQAKRLEEDRLETEHARTEREAQLRALDVDHEPGCARLRPTYRWLGERADGQKVAELRCAMCGATLLLVDDRPEMTPPAVSSPETEPPSRTEPGRPFPGSSRAELETIRDRLPEGRRGYKSIARAAGVSVATVRRRLAGN